MEGRVWKKVDYIVVILQSKFTIQKGEDKKVNVKSLYFTSLARKSHHLALVVQTLDSAIHGINHYPADSVIDFRIIYPLDSAIQRLNNWGLTDKPEVDGALIFLRSTLPHSTVIKRYSKHSLWTLTPTLFFDFFLSGGGGIPAILLLLLETKAYLISKYCIHYSNYVFQKNVFYLITLFQNYLFLTPLVEI